MCKVCVQNNHNLDVLFAGLKEPGWSLLLLLMRERTRELLLLGWEVGLSLLASSFLSSTVRSSLAVGQSEPFILRQQDQAWTLQLRGFGVSFPAAMGQWTPWPASFPPVYLIWWRSPRCGEETPSCLKVLAFYLFYHLLVVSVLYITPGYIATYYCDTNVPLKSRCISQSAFEWW